MTPRQLIDTEALPLNRPGAAAFVIDGCLWCVSKRVLDAIESPTARHSKADTDCAQSTTP